MKDAFGKEISVGDKVVYIHKAVGPGRQGVSLKKGTVVEFQGGRIIKLSHQKFGVTSQSVMKLEK